MSVQSYKSLTISGKVYSETELTTLAQSQITRKSILPWEKNFFQFLLDWLSDADFISIRTSGSTGAAKTIEVEKEKMANSAFVTGQFFNLQKNDKALLCLPVDFIAGKMMVVRSFVLGLDLIPVEPTGDPLKISNMSFDFAAMTPMQVFNTLMLKEGHQKLSRVKKVIIGGGDVNQVLLKKIKALNNKVYHTYGMTETLTHIALKKLNGEEPDSCFYALPGIKFEQDIRNCLVISAPHLSQNKFVTNDIVELNNDQSFNFIGRFDNVINSGGIKISPESVEQKISPFMQDRFIIGSLPDEQLGQKVILVIEGKKRLAIDYSKTALLKYEIPKQVFFIDRFPETESGKIIRRKVLKIILKKQPNFNTKT